MPGSRTGDSTVGRGRPAWLWPLAALVAVAVVIGIVFAILAATGAPPFDDDGPHPADAQQQSAITEVTHSYFDALNSGDAAAFRTTICPDMAEAFGRIADREPLDSPVTPVAISDISVDGDAATASVTVRREGADDDTETVHFRNIDGWRLCQVP
ncbi:Rv0361 family membrane protein [Tomitella gaofuii]|uniref:Rv0361 family membrane protein n=1 Tax=Tomitella gaofuii TaxID=2760083 RepID=UPI0015F864E7|nr:hypothetical protein [Tomitella gaofuii]